MNRIAILFLLIGCASTKPASIPVGPAREGHAAVKMPITRATFASLISGSVVTLELLPGVAFTAVTERVSTEEDIVKWRGSIREAKLYGVALLAIGSAGAAGTVQVDERVFALRPAGGATMVTEVAQDEFPNEGPLTPSPPVPVTAQDEATLPGVSRTELRVLLVMPRNSAWCQLFPHLLPSASEQNLDEVWGRFTKGTITSHVSLYCVNHKPTGRDLEKDLNWVTDNAAVATERARTKSDLVSFLVEKGEGCGIGWYNYPTSSSHADHAFSVVREDCALENYSLAHEIGHNLGMNHDRFAAKGGDPNLCNYGFATVDSLLPHRTVMAYSDYCESKGESCARTGTYSTPFTETMGVVTFTYGIPCSVHKKGIAGSANNVQQLIKAAPIAARWQ